MPVWPFLWAGAGLALVLALLSRDRRFLVAALAICGALIAARIARMGLNPDDAKLALAAAWVCAGATVAKVRQPATTCGLMVLSGLCYFFGRLFGVPIEFGQWPYVMADLFAGAAILMTGWGALNGITVDRGGIVGGYFYRRFFGHYPACDTMAAQKAER